MSAMIKSGDSVKLNIPVLFKDIFTVKDKIIHLKHLFIILSSRHIFVKNYCMPKESAIQFLNTHKYILFFSLSWTGNQRQLKPTSGLDHNRPSLPPHPHPHYPHIRLASTQKEETERTVSPTRND